MTHSQPQGGLLHGLTQRLRGIFMPPSASKSTTEKRGCNDRGLLVFDHTGEVIRAERLLRAAGLDVEVKGPPPQMRTGCDMVVVFELVRQVRALEVLEQGGLVPSQVVSAELMLASSTFMQAQICGDRAGMAAGGLAPEDSSRRP